MYDGKKKKEIIERNNTKQLILFQEIVSNRFFSHLLTIEYILDKVQFEVLLLPQYLRGDQLMSLLII